MVEHPLQDRGAPAAEPAHCTGPCDPAERFEVTLVLRRSDAAGFAHLVQQLVAGAPGAHTLSRTEYAQRFGTPAQDLQRVTDFAHAHGLQVVHADAQTHRVVLSGTAAAYNGAFGVQLQQFEQPKGTLQQRFRQHAGAVQLPSSLQGAVTAVLGLDSRPRARPRFRLGSPQPPLQPTSDGPLKPPFHAAQAGARAFTPLELAQLYDFPPGDGQGQCIGLIELGGGYRDADLLGYFAALGVPAPQVVSIAVDGALPDAGGDPNGPDGEVTLDIEIAGALAPTARLAVYFAPNSDTGFVDAISQALHDSQHAPSVLSISWGAPESTWPVQAQAAFNHVLQTAVVLGVTVCAAAGDSGASDGSAAGVLAVDFPASSPYVLGCGGTRVSATGKQIESETVWNDANGGATGGGVSANAALPAWQHGLSATTRPGGTQPLARRGVPDVAGNADPATGYRVRIGGADMAVGGTSAVAPLWAALIARINAARDKPVGFVHTALYAHAQAFHDITQGNNGGYQATAGWDACTGLGSPRGQQIAAALGAAGAPANTPARTAGAPPHAAPAASSHPPRTRGQP